MGGRICAGFGLELDMHVKPPSGLRESGVDVLARDQIGVPAAFKPTVTCSLARTFDGTGIAVGRTPTLRHFKARVNMPQAQPELKKVRNPTMLTITNLVACALMRDNPSAKPS